MNPGPASVNPSKNAEKLAGFGTAEAGEYKRIKAATISQVFSLIPTLSISPKEPTQA